MLEFSGLPLNFFSGDRSYRQTDDNSCSTLEFNVSGERYHVNKNLLEMLPESTLGNHFKREVFYDAINNEYFLDRHKKSFEVVIDFYFSNHYKSQGLLRPMDIPLDIFIEELRFYELPIPVILDFLESEGIEVIDITYKGKPWSYHVWQFLESPKYSRNSSILHHFNTVMIISM